MASITNIFMAIGQIGHSIDKTKTSSGSSSETSSETSSKKINEKMVPIYQNKNDKQKKQVYNIQQPRKHY
jgi:hypothetical protein